LENAVSSGSYYWARDISSPAHLLSLDSTLFHLPGRFSVTTTLSVLCGAAGYGLCLLLIMRFSNCKCKDI
jgi:hypothetical protein